MCKSYSYTQSSSLSQAQRSEFSAVNRVHHLSGIDTQVQVACPSPCPHLCLRLHSQRQGGSRVQQVLHFRRSTTCTCSFVGFYILYIMVCMFGYVRKRKVQKEGGNGNSAFACQEFGGKLFCTHSTLVCLLSSGTWQLDADADTANAVLVAPSSATSLVGPSSEITFATGQKRMPKIPYSEIDPLDRST